MSDAVPRRSAARRRLASVASTAAVLGACAKQTPAPPVPTPDPVAVAWTAAYDDVRVSIAAGRFAHADSVLTTFRDRYVGMPQSADALYWRAVTRIALVSPLVGARSAIADLDAYRATGAPDHLAEVNALARGLAQLDSARAAPVAAAEKPPVVPRAALVPRDSLRVRDEDLARTRADLAAARAELDRVRRRLAAPGRRP